MNQSFPSLPTYTVSVTMKTADGKSSQVYEQTVDVLSLTTIVLAVNGLARLPRLGIVPISPPGQVSDPRDGPVGHVDPPIDPIEPIRPIDYSDPSQP